MRVGIRLADIEADAGVGMGIFEQLHGKDSAAALAKALNDCSSTNHGTVGREWLRRVVTDRSALSNVITDGVRVFVRETVPAGASGQVNVWRAASLWLPLPGNWLPLTG